MRSRFDRELDNMNNQLIEMGSLCSHAINDAAIALKSSNNELAKKIIIEDEEIDRIEKSIESTCLKLLLQQQPVAKDLRQISAALKMITDMERIGDQAADIAEIVSYGEIVDTQEIIKIQEMAEKTGLMVNRSTKAFVHKDLDLSRKVVESDDEVDDLFEEVKASLVNMIAENKENSQLAVDLLMVAKYLERIGDHATNIAEWVEFSITGVHVHESHGGI